jgi:chemotaxis protein methyltransferase CheR
MSPNTIKAFAYLIQKETGITFNENNLYQLQTRLEEMLKLENMTSIDELLNKVSSISHCSLKQRLIDHATNNETLFFRDPTFYLAIEQFLMQEILMSKPEEIKIWSAASSSGQEAISVAIIIDELSKRMNLPKVTITATDICEKVIQKARKGLYSDFEMSRGLSDERKLKYFNKVTDGWQVKDQILNKIKFGMNNLIAPTVQEKFHLILCRNVLIYQTLEIKRTAVHGLYQRLESDGGILMGVGETMLGIKDTVETTQIGSVIFYRNKAAFKLNAG